MQYHFIPLGCDGLEAYMVTRIKENIITSNSTLVMRSLFSTKGSDCLYYLLQLSVIQAAAEEMSECL